jgi:RepB DNA-primase from phage plasmid
MFIQLDDLTADQLPQLAPAMFLIFETSPGNFQAWLALPGKHDKQLARRGKLATHSDKSASGATRIAGSFNFKDEYASNFPRVTITQAQPGRTTTVDELEGMGLLAPPEEFAPLPPPRPQAVSDRKWPSYAMCLDGAPLNSDGSGPDRSRADYWFCFLAIQWGFGIDETAEQLMIESEKAREYGKGYAHLTARNAKTAVEKRRQQPRRAK